jgi:hypothetical protein
MVWLSVVSTFLPIVILWTIQCDAQLIRALQSPVNVDPDLDCAIKELAWSYAKKLQPQRGSFKSVFDALQLQKCNKSVHGDGKLPVFKDDKSKSTAVSFYCDCANGSDNNPGTINKPVKTITKAIELSRKMGVGVAKTIYLLEGTCTIQAPIDLGPQDSNLTISSYVKNILSKSANMIYCDCSVGNDDNPGTLSAPVKTLLKAIELSRKIGVGIAKTIYLREGTCYLDAPIELGAQDSNLTISGYMQEKVVISGGKLYQFSWKSFKNEMGPLHFGLCSCSDEEWLSNDGRVRVLENMELLETCEISCFKDRKCTSFSYYTGGKYAKKCVLRYGGYANTISSPDCVSGKKILIMSADLSSQNPNNFTSLFLNGRRAVRARYPDGNPETTGLYTNPTGYVPKADSWLPPAPHGAASEIHIQSPIRDGTYFPSFELGIGGPVSAFDPPESYWGLFSPAGGGGSTYVIPTGLQYLSDVEFANYTWKQPQTGVVHAFHCGHWGNWQFQLSDRDMEEKQLTFAYGGWQEARGCKSGAEWYVENIMEELDSPGEWFYDHTTMKLYLYPNGSLPTEGVGTVLDEAIGIRGTMDSPVKGVSIMNVVFAHTATTFLKRYEVPSGGDWSVYRGGTVFVEGVDGFNLQGCLFDAVGGNGVFLSGYVRNAVIQNNEFVWSGDNAIVSVGDTNLIDGTLGTQPRGTKIIGNLVHENGVFGKQTCAYVQSLSCQAEVSENVFFNGPRAGINFNDGFGGGNLMKNNLLFNYVRETADHGPFNSWDRLPYLTKMNDGETPSLTPAESYIHQNFLINNYHSTWPIDHDDGSCYYLDTYNFMVYGGFKNYLGHSKIAQSNVYVYPDAEHSVENLGAFFSVPFCANSDGASRGDTASGWGDVWSNNTCIIGNPNVYSFGSCNLDNPTGLMPFTANNRFYAPSKYVYFGCEGKKLTLEEFQYLGYDLGSTVSDPVDTKTIVTWGKQVLDI